MDVKSFMIQARKNVCDITKSLCFVALDLDLMSADVYFQETPYSRVHTNINVYVCNKLEQSGLICDTA